MKLSYTIRHWPDRDWAVFCAGAVDAGLNGLEIDSVRNSLLTSRNSPTNPELAVAARSPPLLRRPAISWSPMCCCTRTRTATSPGGCSPL